ncbi:MAG TPA: glycosyltransferase family 4 protein [bacterium]|nr:glycosyltransferase family 4 protein [bacterium]
MKVLAANKYYYVKGGTERYYFVLKRILERQGHSVVPFAMEHELNEPSDVSDHFVSFEAFDDRGGTAARAKAAARVLYSREARKKIEALVDATGPDVAHLHNIAHQLSPSILYGLKARGVPVVQTLHDFKLVCPNYQMLVRGKTCERCATWRYYNAVRMRCMRDSLMPSALVAVEAYVHKLLGSYSRNVDVFVAPSRQLRDRMIAHGVDGDRIVHLPNTVALEEYEPRYESEGYGVYVGRLAAGKGLERLLSALARAGDVSFKIVGTGPMAADLQRAAAEKGLSNVEFLGYRSGEELKSIVGGALFVTVPSECFENSPLTVFEAFAQGKPVVGSNIGGIPELVSDGESGLIFEPGDEEGFADRILTLLNDRGLAMEMGKAARNRIETHFGPAVHYERMMEIYERATA